MKRLFDIVVALFFIILLLPFMLIMAMAVAVDSRGGIFYRQLRVGKNNKDFYLLKFRTMQVNADRKGLLTVGSRDPRVTRVGYYLRKYKLDELPQMFNVLAGQMSMVGPRPEVRKYVELYNEEQSKILFVKPGITDYASIEYFNESDLLAKSSNPEETYIREIMPAKLEINKKYIADQSLLVDLSILFKTALRILR